MSRLKWQTKLPKSSIEPGYYFRKRRFPSIGDSYVLVMDITLVFKEEDLRIEKNNVEAWAGPIEDPEEEDGTHEDMSLRPVAHTEITRPKS